MVADAAGALMARSPLSASVWHYEGCTCCGPHCDWLTMVAPAAVPTVWLHVSRVYKMGPQRNGAYLIWVGMPPCLPCTPSRVCCVCVSRMATPPHHPMLASICSSELRIHLGIGSDCRKKR